LSTAPSALRKVLVHSFVDKRASYPQPGVTDASQRIFRTWIIARPREIVLPTPSVSIYWLGSFAAEKSGIFQVGLRARKVSEVMRDDDELPLIAASLAGGIIGASVPMTPDEAVAIFNQVKDALRRQAQSEGVPLLGMPKLPGQHRAHGQNVSLAKWRADQQLSHIRQAAE
jgi:hypothetical protein